MTVEYILRRGRNRWFVCLSNTPTIWIRALILRSTHFSPSAIFVCCVSDYSILSAWVLIFHTSTSPASHYWTASRQALASPSPPPPLLLISPLYLSAKQQMLSVPVNKYQKPRFAVNACKSIFGMPTEQIGEALEVDMVEAVMCLITMCVPR